MRLLICAGGTGGGVYPALAVLSALKTMNEEIAPASLEILWVGGLGGMEVDLVERAGYPFEAISAAGVHGVGLRALPGNLMQLERGYRQSQRILEKFQPDVLFFTGGYVAAPMALAGRNIPALLYVPDIEPGLALKALARFADCIAVTTKESLAYFPRRKETHITGYPTRPELMSWERQQACQALGLAQDLPVLLVFGGSKGARSINRALLSILPELLVEMQVVHISGQLDWAEVQAGQAALPEELRPRYRVFPYLHEQMGAALSAADLALSRAGASSLGEYPLFGLPAILVPYPYAWRYQKVNADYLARHGAAVIVEDADLPALLLPMLRSLMQDAGRREDMRRAMGALAQPDAANHIASLLLTVAGWHSTPGNIAEAAMTANTTVTEKAGRDRPNSAQRRM